jgi:hypothetical protein
VGVEISTKVWEYWQHVEAHCDEPDVVLLFSSQLSPQAAFDALAQAASDAVGQLETGAEPQAGEEEFRTGHWSLAPVPEGIALRIDEEPDDFERLLRTIARGLESAGVAGSFDVYKQAPAPTQPEKVDLLECRLRVVGSRFRKDEGDLWQWKPDRGALAAGVDAGVEWCMQLGSHLPLALVVGATDSFPLTAGVDVRAYVKQGLEQTAVVGVVSLSTVGSDRFRTMAVSASRGRVSLIEGGAKIADGRWNSPLDDLKAAMTSASEWAVYGFIKRGSLRQAAELGTSLSRRLGPDPSPSASVSGRRSV